MKKYLIKSFWSIIQIKYCQIIKANSTPSPYANIYDYWLLPHSKLIMKSDIFTYIHICACMNIRTVFLTPYTQYFRKCSIRKLIYQPLALSITCKLLGCVNLLGWFTSVELIKIYANCCESVVGCFKLELFEYHYYTITYILPSCYRMVLNFV